jgi:acetyl/propionyl-CoA carboxylase alpha subunit
MKFEVRMGEAKRAVEIERQAEGRLRIWLDGSAIETDVIEIGADAYSILLGGSAFEAHVLPSGEGLLVRCDGRDIRVQVRDSRAWRGGRGRLLEAAGRQNVVAPMPGRVVRVLVAAGAVVEVGQGLVVVEAMKMQNEIRAPKNGTVERVFVQEGQTVTAGESLLVIA